MNVFKATSGLAGALAIGISSFAHSAVTIEPITWNVIGLDSNKPAEIQAPPGVYPPKSFPVGVRVCWKDDADNGDDSAALTTKFVWIDNAQPAFLTLLGDGDGNDTVGVDDVQNPTAVTEGVGDTDLNVGVLADGQCRDMYYQLDINTVPEAYDNREGYRVDVVETAAPSTALDSTPVNREFWVEYLVSQNRNQIDGYLYTGPKGPEQKNPGTAIEVITGQTFELEIQAHTATQGYEQLEVFMTLDPRFFRVNEVSSTYTANAGTDLNAFNKLYADGCGWINDRTSDDYHNNGACGQDGKYGGTITKVYSVTVLAEPPIDLNGDNYAGKYTGQTMIYDFSGSSYHYNSDYQSGGLNFDWVQEASDRTDLSISKVGDSPNDKLSNFTITVTNDGPAPAVSSAAAPIIVTDTLPAGYVLKNPEGGVTTSGGATHTSNITYNGGLFAVGEGTSAAIIWDVGDGEIPVGGSLTLDLNVFYSGTAGLAPSDFENCATVSHIDSKGTVPTDDDVSVDSNLANNTDCDSLPGLNWDLSVQKTVTADPTPAELGSLTLADGQVLFLFEVTNVSAIGSDVVYLEDVFPSGYLVDTTKISPAGIADATAGNTVVWQVPALAAGASSTVFRVVANVTAPTLSDNLDSKYLNTAEILDGTSVDNKGVYTKVRLNDAVLGNNTASAAFIPPVLEISKTSDGDLPSSAPFEYTYFLEVTKIGGFIADDTIVVSENPPPGASIVMVSESGSGVYWDCNAATQALPSR